MKLQLVSDLHLSQPELDGAYQLPKTDADVLVFAGDIANGMQRAIGWVERQVERLGIPGVFVAGNHEYYRGVFPDALTQARAVVRNHVDLRILDCEQTAIGDIRILGCTLWTDFLLFGADEKDDARSAAEMVLADYQGTITVGNGEFLRADDTQAAHRRARQWLETQLAAPWSGKTVVVSHHGPHRQLAHPAFGNHATAGFVSHLDELIARYHIDLWISGHTHYNHDLVDAGTRFVGNQRGYAIETVPGRPFDPALVVEI